MSKSPSELLLHFGSRVRNLMKKISGTPSLTFVSTRTLSDEKFLDLFGLQEVSDILEIGDVQNAKRLLLQHFGRRVKSGWAVPPANITDLRLDLDEVSGKEILEWAQSILEHRFQLTGYSPKWLPNGQIDWFYNPDTSVEWLWKLHRHAWWPVLGLAYQQNPKKEFAEAFVGQMVDWVEKNPPPTTKNEASPSWRLMETAMRMRVSWLPAFSLFYESEAFTLEAKMLMLRSIYDHGRFLFSFHTSCNHFLRESNGLAFVGTYFPEFKEAEIWKRAALKRLEDGLLEQVNQDGSHIEMSTGYQWLVLDEFEKTYELLQENHLSLPNQDLTHWLEKMYEMLLYLVRPDGLFPQVNDGFIHYTSSRFLSAGKQLGREDFLFVGSAGSQGVPPSSTSMAFEDAGRYVMRSNWSREAHYLTFDAGPYGGTHGHEDMLSIEVSAFGHPFIVDSGSFTYERSNPFRAYFVGSQGHNTVLVDGHSQIRRWQPEHLRAKTGKGKFATWVSRKDFDYVDSSYDEGYGIFSLVKPKEAQVIEDVVHTRRILFVKPDYWILVDELKSPKPHSYQILFHAFPEIEVEVSRKNRAMLKQSAGRPCLNLIQPEMEAVSVQVVSGLVDPIQGWYSSQHNQKTASSVVIYEIPHCVSPLLVTLLFPCSNEKESETVNIEQLPIAGGGVGQAFKVSTPKGSDYLMISQDNHLKRFGEFCSRGRVKGIRTDDKGNIFSQFEWEPGSES